MNKRVVVSLLMPVFFAVAVVGVRWKDAIEPPMLAAPTEERAVVAPNPARKIAVVIAGNGGAELTDLLIPYETLGETGAFDLYVVAPRKQVVSLASAGSLNGGIELLPHFGMAEYDEEVRRSPDLIVVPYLPAFGRGGEAGLVEWIRRHADNGAQVLSICAGAEVLAATGLIDGDHATTHPSFFERLRKSRPQVSWERDVRYVEGKRAISSGAIASGMDATLAAIRRVLGEAQARAVADRLGYAHARYLTNRQASSTLFGLGALARSSFSPVRERTGVVLYEGVSEAALGSVFDAFSITGGYQLESVAPVRRTVVSKHGLQLVPRYALVGAPELDALFVPGRQIDSETVAYVENAALGRSLPLTYLHTQDAGFPYDAALRTIALRDSRLVASSVANALNYPIDHLALEGPAIPVELLGVPLLLMLVSFGVFSLASRQGRRRIAMLLERWMAPRRRRLLQAAAVVVIALSASGTSIACATLQRHTRAPAACTDSAQPFASPKPAVDLDPDPNVVRVKLVASEVQWEISPGCVATAWGYNGQVPGPTIQAKAGDTVVVNLENRLPEPTTIHWHGLRVPAAMDGTEVVQKPVLPGASFEYRFTVPDVGTFWYHPHAHETVQMERGLYGAFVVRGDAIRTDAERVLVLDDVLLDAGGQIAAPGGKFEVHDGREGNVRLVSGRTLPTISMAAGQLERWRIINASSARYVRLGIGGLPLTLVATDGGPLPKPALRNDVLLTPGDRVELVVGPFEEGAVVRLDSLPFDRGLGESPHRPLAIVKAGAQMQSRARIPEHLAEIAPLAPMDAAPQRTVKLGGRMSVSKGVVFSIDGKEHGVADPVQVGDLQVWDVSNETPIAHPFHLHGFFFQVLDDNGSRPEQLSWEDTVNVPAKGTVRIAFKPDDRPGSWMYHCHILEHASAGMMADFQVVPRKQRPDSRAPLSAVHLGNVLPNPMNKLEPMRALPVR